MALPVDEQAPLTVVNSADGGCLRGSYGYFYTFIYRIIRLKLGLTECEKKGLRIP